MKLGLCCISEILKENEKLHFRTMTRKSFKSMKREAAIAKLTSIFKHNFIAARKTITHAAKIGAHHYRFSSSMMPRLLDPECFPDSDESAKLEAEAFTSPEFNTLFVEVHRVRHGGFSFSSHPSQFVVLGSHNPYTVLNSFTDLDAHGRFHSALGLPEDLSNPINIHVSSSPGKENVSDFVNRFAGALAVLSPAARNRLSLENEDKGFWNAQQLWNWFSTTTALCFDNLHDSINRSDGRSTQYRELFETTWKGHRPVFHLSEGIGESNKHADYISSIPDVYDGFTGVLEVEVKAKDKAILQLLKNK